MTTAPERVKAFIELRSNGPLDYDTIMEIDVGGERHRLETVDLMLLLLEIDSLRGAEAVLRLDVLSKLPDCPKCHGTKRVIDYHATAVRDIDNFAGYPLQFSPDPELTKMHYANREARLISGEARPNWQEDNAVAVDDQLDWVMMDCPCKHGKIPLVKAVEVAVAIYAQEPRAMNYATMEQWLEELKS